MKKMTDAGWTIIKKSGGGVTMHPIFWSIEISSIKATNIKK